MNADTFDRDELRRSHMEDAAGFTPERTSWAIEGTMGGIALGRPEMDRGRTVRPKVHNHNIPTVDHDSNNDPEYTVKKFEPLSQEQLVVLDHGLSLTRAVGDFVETDEYRSLSKNEREIVLQQFIDDYNQTVE